MNIPKAFQKIPTNSLMYLIGSKYKPIFETFGYYVLERYPPLHLYTAEVEKERFFKTFQYTYKEEYYNFERNQVNRVCSELSGYIPNTNRYIYETINITNYSFYYKLSCEEETFESYKLMFELPDSFKKTYKIIKEELK